VAPPVAAAALVVGAVYCCAGTTRVVPVGGLRTGTVLTVVAAVAAEVVCAVEGGVEEGAGAWEVEEGVVPLEVEWDEEGLEEEEATRLRRGLDVAG
jgi:hypothetical protein